MNKWMHRFLLWLTTNKKVRVFVRNDGTRYLERYHICFLGSWRVYLHHLVSSDPEGLHNHPWKYGFSFILCGKYIEENRLDKAKLVRWFNIVNGDKFHRLICTRWEEETWSLFIHSPKIANWGFLKDKGMFIQYHEVGSGAGDSHWHLNPDTYTGKEIRNGTR